MGYFGGYFGQAGGGGEDEPPEGPEPLPVPVEFGDVEYVDHTALALDRLCEQFVDHEDEELE